MSSSTRICPSQAAAGADADGGDRHRFGDPAGQRFDHPLDHHGKGAGLGHRRASSIWCCQLA
jgi:hypothetical protein